MSTVMSQVKEALKKGTPPELVVIVGSSYSTRQELFLARMLSDRNKIKMILTGAIPAGKWVVLDLGPVVERVFKREEVVPPEEPPAVPVEDPSQESLPPDTCGGSGPVLG